jgi:hypothetical protein
MRKIAILIFIISIAISLTYGLIYYIKMHEFLFAWMLNLVLMMCVYGFTETLKSSLKSSYFNEKNWELRGKLYEQLGINFFRKILVWVGWEKLNKKSNPIEKHTKSLIHLYYRTKQSELGHIIIMVIVLGFNIFVAIKFGFVKSSWLLVLNILLNLYPIFLQRYNRPRLERAINLSKHKEGRLYNKSIA